MGSSPHRPNTRFRREGPPLFAPPPRSRFPAQARVSGDQPGQSGERHRFLTLPRPSGLPPAAVLLLLALTFQPCCSANRSAKPGEELFTKAEQGSVAVSRQIQEKEAASRQESQKELEATEERNRDLAIQKYRAVLTHRERLDPAAQESSLINLGHILFEQCLARYRKAMKHHDEAYVRFKRGEGPEPELPRYDFGPAREVYHEFLERFSRSAKAPEVMYNLAYAYEEEGDLDRAVALYDELALSAPEARFAPEVYLRLGEHHFEINQLDRAIVYYQKAGEIRDSAIYDKALFKIGWCHYARGDMNRAKDAFAQVLDSQSGRAEKRQADLVRESLEILAKILSETGGAAALDDFLARHRNPPYGLDLSLQLGDTFQQTSRYQEAVETYRRLLQNFALCPQAPFIEQSLIKALQTETRVTEAEDLQASLMDRYGHGTPWDRSNPDPELRRQVDVLLQESLDGLVVARHRAARESKDPAEYARAIALYQRALKFFPADEKAYEVRFRYAECLFESGRLEEAAREYERVAKTEPHQSYREKAASRRIQCLEQLRSGGRADTDTLLAAYGDYAQLHPQSDKTPPLLFKQGEILFNASRYSEASVLFDKLIRAYPQNPEIGRAWVLQTETLFQAGRYPELESLCRELQQKALPFSGEQSKRIDHLLRFAQFEQARRDQEQGNFAAAATRYEQLVEEAPQEEIAPDALFNAAICYRESNDWPRAAACFERILTRYPHSPHYREAVLAPLPHYEQTRQWDRILGLLDKLYRIDPRNEMTRESHYRIAKKLYQEGQLEKARETFAAYAGKYPEDSARTLEIAYLEAWIREKQGDAAAALEGYQRFLNSYRKLKSAGSTPDVDPEYLARSQFLLLDPVFRNFQAIRLREPLQDNLKRKQALLDSVVNGYLETAKFGAGETSLAAAFRVGEAYEEFAGSLLNSELPRGLDEEETPVYRDLLAKQADPYLDKAGKAYGVALESARDQRLFNPWVMKAYGRLSVLDPRQYPPLLQDAVVWTETWKEKRTLIRSLDLAQRRPFGRERAANLQAELEKILAALQGERRKGQTDSDHTLEIIRQFNQMLAREPSLYEVHCNLGVLYQMLGDPRNAEREYLLALGQQPLLPLAHLNLGLLYLEENRPEQAEPRFLEMTKQNPRYAGAWYLLGVARNKRQDYVQAVSPLQEAIALLPQFLDPYVELGWAQTRSGKTEEARGSYAAVLNHPKVNDRLLRKLAWCFLQGGPLAEAVHTYQRLATAKGEYEDWNNLGVAHLRRGDRDQAGKALAKAWALDRNRPEVHNNLGRLSLEQKDSSQAAAYFLQASQLDPAFLPALLNAAVVYGQYLENTEKALELIRRYLDLGGSLNKELLGNWAEQPRPEGTAEHA